MPASNRLSANEKTTAVYDGPIPDPQAWLALMLLTIVMFFSYLDRFILAILIQPIKADLKLSDSEIGLLTGFAFSAVYATFGIPLARLADRTSRRNLICISLVAWSTMTAAFGAVQAFWHMLVARAGVGIGEAGSVPATHSMIADLFPPERRATAMAIFGSGAHIGMLGGFAIGGWIEAHLGWRGTFVAVGVPGILLAIILRFAITEPVRGRFSAAEFAPQHSSTSVVRDLWSNEPLRHILIGSALSVVLLYGQTQWLPAYLERSFGAVRSEIGVWIASTRGIGMVVGMILGGIISDRLSRTDRLWPAKMVLICTALSAVPDFLVYLAPTATAAYALSGTAGFLSAFAAGPLLAMLQFVVQPDRRALASGVFLALSSFVGGGGGPLLIGVLSDVLHPTYQEESLRYAMLSINLLIAPIVLYQFAMLYRKLRLQDSILPADIAPVAPSRP